MLVQLVLVYCLAAEPTRCVEQRPVPSNRAWASWPAWRARSPRRRAGSPTDRTTCSPASVARWATRTPSAASEARGARLGGDVFVHADGPATGIEATRIGPLRHVHLVGEHRRDTDPAPSNDPG